MSSVSQVSGPTYLFSVDLEDVRRLVPDGLRFRPRVPQTTKLYLDFLEMLGAKATFFVVGEVAEEYPDLIRLIADKGHELACHTHSHVPLDKQTAASLCDDLQRNIDALRKAGAGSVSGFRAPTFSLTADTRWAYPVLRELGFRYSSSVLPAKNPLYGWPGFGEEPRVIDGILELPMTLGTIGPLAIPFGGGVYFRMLPRFALRRLFRLHAKDRAVLGYFHPYDIDLEQERFMHPAINNNRAYNWLMYYNRRSVIPKLKALVKAGFQILRYDHFVSRHCQAGHP